MRAYLSWLYAAVLAVCLAAGPVGAQSGAVRSPQAQAAFERAAELVRPYLSLGIDKAALDEPGRAQLRSGIALLRRLTTQEPRDWPAWFFLGKADQALGEQREALAAFKSAAELNPDNASVVAEYGLTCFELGQAEPAIAAMQRAVALEPSRAGWHSNLALAYLIGGRNEEALASVNRALEMAPQDEPARNLQRIVRDVMSGKRAQPKSGADI